MLHGDPAWPVLFNAATASIIIRRSIVLCTVRPIHLLLVVLTACLLLIPALPPLLQPAKQLGHDKGHHSSRHSSWHSDDSCKQSIIRQDSQEIVDQRAAVTKLVMQAVMDLRVDCNKLALASAQLRLTCCRPTAAADAIFTMKNKQVPLLISIHNDPAH